ncbi:binding-protein-dependent transport systems inner membrane component [Denitrovibrio acetiphilus DSM 12809]|uniref:Binding-protein-dependent transport systems inner membrane component n=1 Tax=Denitrovibrio acetiphilus (strain DSM 12809 / NBRC 114555 / N2460) TaxID=522772 RepID=D4H728_DENA2|nr:ABC transporter permease [Denitrovibrio acetiphilus]ADD69732.1 binding-protein-dependent transport systems inner membrane component [Denitrovibrio acetiphilus DSM 12809]
MVRSKIFSKVNGNILFYSGMVIVVIFFLVAIFAPYIATYDPTHIDFDSVFLPPSAEHYFGTDDLGRDVYSRVVYGSRISLFVGFVAVGISLAIGVLLGLVAGYFGGFADAIIMRFVDIMLCFPAFFLILAVIAFLSPSMFNVMAIIGLTGWMGVTRLVRAEVLSVKTRDYIVSARVQGLPVWLIMSKHILPNVITPIFVTATLGVAGAILTESSLSFLGLGVQPPTPSWGNILTAGKDNIMFAWWLSFFPGIAIFITVLGYNLLGEGLRDILDPKH